MYGRKIKRLDWVFDFGKHKGTSIEDVIENDLNYIEWLDENKVISFSGEVLDAVKAAQLDDSEDEFSDLRFMSIYDLY